MNRLKLVFNGKDREKWKDRFFYQIYHPWNKEVNALDDDEYLYAFCLFPGDKQPSGTTNLTHIEEFIMYFEINDQIIELMRRDEIDIKIKVWECSYNIFVAMSGFGALEFYSP